MSKKYIELEERVSRLEKSLKDLGLFLCPLCGSQMSKSNKFVGKFMCKQENGFCGEWLLSNRRRRGCCSPFTAFHRTTIRDGEIDPVGNRHEVHMFFIGGDPVDEDEYFERVDSWNA